MSFIPLCIPEIRGREWDYVKECLDTGWVSSVGKYVERFEQQTAERVGCRYAVATASGTAALHVALLIAGVEPDDEVLVSSLTFIAPVNAIRYVGAWPVFIDSEPDYWQFDPAAAERFLREECERTSEGLRNRTTGRRVKAMVPVHVLGHPLNLDPVLDLAREFGLPLIQDSTECLGATYQGVPVGDQGDMACFSFNGNKIITTGGGGMLVTSNPEFARRARYLTTQAKDDPVEYVHNEIGFNYRMTNVQAAMGCAQLELLDDYVAAKRAIAARYREGLPAGLTPMRQAPWAGSIEWMFTVLVDQGQSRPLLKHLDEQGIQTRPLWQPIHRSPSQQAAQRRECPVADRLHRDALSLPCSVGLTPADQERVLEEVRRFALAHRP